MNSLTLAGKSRGLIYFLRNDNKPYPKEGSWLTITFLHVMTFSQSVNSGTCEFHPSLPVAEAYGRYSEK